MPFPPAERLSPRTDFPWPPQPSDAAAPPRSDDPAPFPEAAPTPFPEPAVWRYPARASASRAQDTTKPARETDPPADTADRPVVLIHGFRGDHHGLALIAHDLRRRDVWVPDLPGFGRTSPPAGGLDLDAFTTFIRALCAACEAATGRRPLLVGHSFGSVLVAHAVAQDPAICRGVGLLSPIVQPPLEGSARFLTQLTRLYYAAGRALPQPAGAALLAHPVIVRAMSEVMATSHDRMTRAYIHDQHARHFSDYADRTSLAQAYEVSTRHTVAEAAAGLAHSAHPLLVVAGDDDLIAPLPAARGFVEDLRGLGADVDLQELGGVGHLLHYERPHHVAGAIEEFTAGLDAEGMQD